MGAAALLGVAIMMLNIPPGPEHKEGDRHGWAMLQRARPTVDWNKSTLRRADMSGDGQVTRVMMGRDDDGSHWIGVVRPDSREGPHNPTLVGVGEPAQLTLSFHKLESPEHCLAGDTPLDGCRPRKGKRGLTISLGEGVPPQRVYWHASLRRFTVWVP